MTSIWAPCVFPCAVIGFLHSDSPPGEQEDLVVSYNTQNIVGLLLVQWAHTFYSLKSVSQYD